jgi:hypothetical protein
MLYDVIIILYFALNCNIFFNYAVYFPVKKYFDEGGFEARTDKHKGVAAGKITEDGKKLLKELFRIWYNTTIGKERTDSLLCKKLHCYK